MSNIKKKPQTFRFRLSQHQHKTEDGETVQKTHFEPLAHLSGDLGSGVGRELMRAFGNEAPEDGDVSVREIEDQDELEKQINEEWEKNRCITVKIKGADDIEDTDEEEVLAALDEASDADSLEDDFMECAIGSGESEKSSDIGDEIMSDDFDAIDDKIEDYDGFQNLLHDEYGDEAIGELDSDDGARMTIDPNSLLASCSDFIRDAQHLIPVSKRTTADVHQGRITTAVFDEDKVSSSKILQLASNITSASEDSDTEDDRVDSEEDFMRCIEEVGEVPEPASRRPCVVPNRLKAPRTRVDNTAPINLDRKLGLPIECLPEHLKRGAISMTGTTNPKKCEEAEPDEMEIVVTQRKKGETPEDKRARKKAVKGAQRGAREARAARVGAVREEELRRAAGRVRNPFDVHDGVRRIRL
eukprot:GHVO01066098.1.p1 GENE.GHVO01066098.1~~GHVO01066098.1.p1  ORF type:complete len:414 (-),score=107.98 GHVO01066098.1:351-1592(-)